MMNLDLALIGNCQYGALLDASGSVVWACFPRFDSPSVFGSLLGDDAAGRWTIAGEGEGWETDSRYMENTCVVETRWRRDDQAFDVIDFAPRFSLYDRMYRPPMMVRLVRRVSGRPRVQVTCDPRFDYGKTEPVVTRGSNHITFQHPESAADTLRLSTDASITAVSQSRPFELKGDCHFALAWGEPFEDDFSVLDSFFTRTHAYWRNWCKGTRIPVNYQDVVLRAAMTLKLHTFEDTGAVIAATTTSIPEFDGGGRNWDYRYCWVRDAAFVVRSLLKTGHVSEAAEFCGYLRNIIPPDRDGDLELQPVYGIDGREELVEDVLDHLPGYRGNQPVRIGNDAYTHRQNDVYGEVVLALFPMFYDKRLVGTELEPVYETIEHVVGAAIAAFDTEDAGIWEFRDTNAHHVFSKFMGWVAVERGARIAEKLGHSAEHARWTAEAERMKSEILERGYNENVGSFVASYGSEDLDGSLLLMPVLGFLPVDDPRMVSTVAAMREKLVVNDYAFRYRFLDDFGEQKSAFTICSTWLVEALWLSGQEDEAVALFEKLLDARNRFGLLSEDVDPETGELWGNFPQTYSMLGLINCAVLISPRWSEIF